MQLAIPMRKTNRHAAGGITDKLLLILTL